jgi:hypothetical protein
MSPLLSIMEQLKQKPKTDTDIFKRLERYGLKAPDQLNKEYNAGVDEREGDANEATAGTAAGIVASVLLGTLTGNNATSNINNAMPALAGLSTVAGMNKENQAKADRDYPVALRNYYDALFRMDEKNDAIGRENRNIDLEMAKAQHKPQELSYDDDEFGRKVIIDKRTGKVIDYVKGKDGQPLMSGSNKVEKRHADIQKRLDVYRGLLDKTDAKQRKDQATLEITNNLDPEMSEMLKKVIASGASDEVLKSLIKESLTDLINQKRKLKEAGFPYEINPNDYKAVEQWDKPFFDKLFPPEKATSGTIPSGNNSSPQATQSTPASASGTQPVIPAPATPAPVTTQPDSNSVPADTSGKIKFVKPSAAPKKNAAPADTGKKKIAWKPYNK